ncbi:hypothetical protein G4X40_02590 [Rhodococcus sp. D2-41]|uniref:Secreted protein n=1 Tax=Speluncibacter jeojiensis TaxID=2710754 RepID=A0A9X4RE58_9ACTN|nr:hypothetical protein [Rhodococcus sp. D2-41]MDG3009034.1 hypothetical protein [Rhodococcus sp. D2-41]MDG3015545.1 hypothetical protein [Corynebacteriales bacterium D3-21]
MTTPNHNGATVRLRRAPARALAVLLATAAFPLVGAGVAAAADLGQTDAIAGSTSTQVGPSLVVGCAGQYESRPYAVRLHCDDASSTISAIDWTDWTQDKAKGVGTLDNARVEIVLDLSESVPGQPYRVFSRALLSGAQGVQSVQL